MFVFNNEGMVLMMKYSGKGAHMTSEKTERKDIFNALGGHVEKDESVIENAIKETREEAGIKLLEPKIKGIINVSNFSGKDVMLFIVTGKTQDQPLKSTLEGELEWVASKDIAGLNVFPDLKIIMEQLLSLKSDQMIEGWTRFDGKFGLLDINLRVV